MDFYIKVVLFLLMIASSFIAGQFVYYVLFRFIFPKDRKMGKNIGRVFNYILYIGILYGGIVYVLGQDINSLVAAFGIIGIAIAFASQQTMANLFASLVIGIQGNLKEDDTIEINGLRGKVKDINLLTVIIRTKDGELATIPKALFMQGILINYTAGKVLRVKIPLKVNLDENWEKVKSTLIDTCHNDPNVLPEIPREINFFERLFGQGVSKKTYNPQVVITGLTKDFLQIELRVWIFDIPNKDEVVSDLLLSLRDALKKSKIFLKE